MATKFKLEAKPTFKAKVSIPVPGGKAEPVEFEFKYLTKDEYADTFKSSGELSDKELIQKVVVGWELDNEFNEENLNLLLQNYQRAAHAIVKVFADELGPARLGN